MKNAGSNAHFFKGHLQPLSFPPRGPIEMSELNRDAVAKYQRDGKTYDIKMLWTSLPDCFDFVLSLRSPWRMERNRRCKTECQ